MKNTHKLEQLQKQLNKINWFMFIAGMLGVWVYSHNWVVMFFAFFASIHLTATNKKI